MFHDLTKGQKRSLREAADLAHERDLAMPVEDRDVHYLEAANPDLPLVVAAAVADGLLTEDEIREPARELVRDLAERIRSMRESVAHTPASEPPNSYVPDAPVSLGTILELVDMLDDLSAIYLNRSTGEAIVLHEDELAMDDELEEEDDSLPQWQQDSMKRVREIRESDEWLEVATRMDIDEFAIMKRFATGARPSVSKALLDALHGKGAFRRFRDAVHQTGSEAEWQEFRSARIAREIRATLDVKGVKYRR